MVTTRYSDQQGSKSRQKVIRLYKQWHRPMSKRFIKPPYSISRATSIDTDCCRLPPTSVLSNKADKLLSNQFYQQVQVSQSPILYKIRKTEIPRSMVVEALSWRSRRASQHPAAQSPMHLKKPHESCPFAAPCGPRKKKNDRGQTSAFPSETSRFKPVILAHSGSALPWLDDDRAALRLRRI